MLSETWTKSILCGLFATSAIAYQIEIPACDRLNERKSWNALTDDEKLAYLDAEVCLQNHDPVVDVPGSRNLWDEIDFNHITQSNNIHYVGQFLPWHRYYVRAHEILLQTLCNYTGAHPYWDELTDYETAPLNQSSLFDPVTGFGGNGVGEDGCVSDGPFQNLTLNYNRTWGQREYCLYRDFSESSFAMANRTLLEECYAKKNYSDAWQCFNDNGPHGAGHGAVGGLMGDPVASSGDPTFFMHHAYLDRVWWHWQKLDLPARYYDMAGDNVPPDYVIEEGDQPYPDGSILDYNGDPGNVTTLNHTLWMLGIVPNVTVGQVMNLTGDVICATYVD